MSRVCRLRLHKPQGGGGVGGLHNECDAGALRQLEVQRNGARVPARQGRVHGKFVGAMRHHSLPAVLDALALLPLRRDRSQGTGGWREPWTSTLRYTHAPSPACVVQACGEGAGPCVLPKIEGCATGAGLDYTMLSGCVGDKRRASRLQHEFGACVAPRECLELSGEPDCPPSRHDTLQCSPTEVPPRVPCGRSCAHAERSLVCAVGGGRGQAAQELRGASEARVPEVQGREQAGGVRQGRGRDGGRRCLHLEQCRMPRRVVSAALPRPGRGGRELARGGGGTQRARRHDPMTVTGSSLYPMGGQHHPRTIYRAATRAVQRPAACFPS